MAEAVKVRHGCLHGYGEMALIVVCVGIASAAPLGVQGEAWGVIFWTAASNMASYVKGKLETKPGKAQEAQSVIVENQIDNPVPVEEKK